MVLWFKMGRFCTLKTKVRICEKKLLQRESIELAKRITRPNHKNWARSREGAKLQRSKTMRKKSTLTKSQWQISKLGPSEKEPCTSQDQTIRMLLLLCIHAMSNDCRRNSYMFIGKLNEKNAPCMVCFERNQPNVHTGSVQSSRARVTGMRGKKRKPTHNEKWYCRNSVFLRLSWLSGWRLFIRQIFFSFATFVHLASKTRLVGLPC